MSALHFVILYLRHNLQFMKIAITIPILDFETAHTGQTSLSNNFGGIDINYFLHKSPKRTIMPQKLSPL